MSVMKPLKEGRTVKMLVCLLAISFMAQPAPTAGTACAFEFQVSSPDGKPLANQIVRLRSESGLEQEGSTDWNGEVRFCDARQEFHELTVGGPWCGQTRVSYITPALPETFRYRVTYKNCHGSVALGGCSYVLRFQTPEGKPVKSRQVLLSRGEKIDRKGSTDEYGRFFIFLPYESEVFLHPAEGQGDSAKVRLQCRPGGGERKEREIVLRE